MQGYEIFVDTEAAHAQLLDDCLEALSAHLKRDICGVHDPGIALGDSRLNQAKLSSSLPLHIRYAAYHWFLHLKHSVMGAGSMSKVDTFLHKHLLHWVEALSLIGKYAEAVEIVSDLYESLVGTYYNMMLASAPELADRL